MTSIWIKSEVPIFEGEIIVGRMDVRVYAMADTGCKNGIADDVEFEDVNGRWYGFDTEERDFEILALIEKYDPEAYTEILCAREANALASSEAA